jgi:hypothetical protein
LPYSSHISNTLPEVFVMLKWEAEPNFEATLAIKLGNGEKNAGMVFGMNACPHLCNGFPTRASRSLGQRSKSYVIRPRAGHQFNWKISIISGWWFQPTPLKNDGVKVSWDDEKFPWKFP